MRSTSGKVIINFILSDHIFNDAVLKRFVTRHVSKKICEVIGEYEKDVIIDFYPCTSDICEGDIYILIKSESFAWKDLVNQPLTGNEFAKYVEKCDNTFFPYVRTDGVLHFYSIKASTCAPFIGHFEGSVKKLTQQLIENIALSKIDVESKPEVIITSTINKEEIKEEIVMKLHVVMYDRRLLFLA